MLLFPKNIGHLALIGILLFSPQVSFAQAYVPVRDSELISDFNKYMNNFDNYVKDFNNTFGGKPTGTSDAIRDLISGGDPNMGALGECAQQDAELLATSRAKDRSSPWYRVAASSSAPDIAGNVNPDPIPDEYPSAGVYVQTNKSESLRCLLKEIVQFQKLNASTQIHQILLQYITNAQVKQLSNQLGSQVAAANIDFAKSGRVYEDGGVTVAEPLYDTTDASYYNVADREVKHLSSQIVAPLGAPIGGLGYYDGFALDAAGIALDAAQTVDPYDETINLTQSSLTGGDGIFANDVDYEEFLTNPNTDKNLYGFWGSWGKMLNEPQNTGLGMMTVTNAIAQDRAATAQEGFKSDQVNGINPTVENISDATVNPYSIRRYQTRITPAGLNQQVINRAAETGVEQIAEADSAGEEPTQASREQALGVSSAGGLSGYNINNLARSPNKVNEIISELYNIMYYGYFDISLDTTDWARATMLMTYDQMLFDDQTPKTELPENTANTTSGPSIDTTAVDPEIDWFGF